MNISRIRQVNINALGENTVDAVIVASGYESRATNFAQKIETLDCKRRFALSFTDRKVLAREANDRYFSHQGFEAIKAHGNTGAETNLLLEQIVSKSSKDKLTLAIDYSCMTRNWYATILTYFARFDDNLNEITLYFAYSPSYFVKPFPTTPNAVMGPVDGFSAMDLPSKPNALIMGLGYEYERALGLTECVEATALFAFYTDPAAEPRYTELLFKNNKRLIDRLGKHLLFPYPFDDLRATDAMLSSLCLGLRSKYRIILAPLGPKPFSLLCLLLALRYPGIDVWRVSAGVEDKPIDRKPTGNLIYCAVTMSRI